MIEGLKPIYNGFLRPVARLFAFLHIHPNSITGFGVVLFAFAGYLIAVGRWRLAVVVGICGALMDGLDGIVAREFGGGTVFGAVWDSVCDRLTEIAVFAGLLMYYLRLPEVPTFPALMVFVAITGSISVSYVKARAEGAGLVCKSGFLQRPERLLILGAGFFLGEKGIFWATTVVGVLGYITVVQRLVEVAGNAKVAEERESVHREDAKSAE